MICLYLNASSSLSPFFAAKATFNKLARLYSHAPAPQEKTPSKSASAREGGGVQSRIPYRISGAGLKKVICGAKSGTRRADGLHDTARMEIFLCDYCSCMSTTSIMQ